MEKGKSAPQAIEISLKKLDLNDDRNSKSSHLIPSLHSSRLRVEKTKPPSLLSLCLGVVGRDLEYIIEDLSEIAVNFPADIKISLAAIARRRKLRNDDVVISLADSSWEILDLSGSEVSDFGLAKVAEMCKSLRAVDISQCNKITANGVSELVQHCHSLETLRCGL